MSEADPSPSAGRDAAFREIAALLDPLQPGEKPRKWSAEARYQPGEPLQEILLPDPQPAEDAAEAFNTQGSVTTSSPDAGKRRRGRPRKQITDAAARAPDAQASAGKRAALQDIIDGIIDRCEFWHSADGESFVTYEHASRKVNSAVKSSDFKRHLTIQVYELSLLVPGTQRTLSDQAMNETLRLCEAKGYVGPEKEPMLRVGEVGGHLFVDLCDDAGTIVDISAHGVELRTGKAMTFVRKPGMRPLCPPAASGTTSIAALRPFLNVASDDDFILAVAFLLGAIRAIGPFPILTLNGQQGSGKSTHTRMLRHLIDPNTAPIRAMPKDGRDMIISAMNGHVLAFDNLSSLTGESSDALCRLATGGGNTFRKLFSDTDEITFNGTRPCILNGIPALAERADLADRAIGIRLVTIEESARRTEADLWREFEVAAPKITAALYDAASAGLDNLPFTKLDRPPRLADFATWVAACEPALPWEPGAFLRAFNSNRREVAASAFEADAVAVAVRDFIRDDYPRGWTGTATELLGLLNTRTPEDVRRSRTWPQIASALGSRLDRAAPVLRGQGIVVERKHSGSRFLSLALKEPTQ